MTEDKPMNEQNQQRGGAIPQDLIDPINDIAHNKTDKGFTEEEQAEQKRLRETYLSLFRENFRSHIEMLQVYDKDGKEVTPEKVKRIQRERGLRDD